MIIGIGVDLVEISRVSPMVDRDFQGFAQLFTEREIEESRRHAKPAIYFCERFACKEALFKCLDLTMDINYLRDIETTNNHHGKPSITVSGKIKEIMDQKVIDTIHVSLSQDGNQVVAFVICSRERA